MTEINIEAEYENYKDDAPVADECINTGDGPCRKCPNETGDKDICSEECLRLKAFQYNRPFRHLPYYQKTITLAQIASQAAESPKTTEPRSQVPTPWKRAMPVRQRNKPVLAPTKDADGKTVKLKDQAGELTYKEKMKIIRETTVCLNCGRDASKYPLRRGLCLARCSGAWRDGRLFHSVLGMWKKMTKEEVNEARYGRYDECLINGCTEIGDRRGLCRKHYRAWVSGAAECVAILGVFKRKGSKTEAKKAMSEQVIYEAARPEKSEELVITIDFTNYRKIHNELKAQAAMSMLPIAHVLFNTLAIGLGRSENNEKKN